MNTGISDDSVKDYYAFFPHQKRTVSGHISHYKKAGIEALVPIRQPGAPGKLSDAQEAELLSVISTKTPQEAYVGVFANWTAAPV